MAVLRHVATLAGGAGQFLANITDLLLDGQGRLYATTRAGGGFSLFDVTGGGAPALLAEQAFPGAVRHLAEPQGLILSAPGMAPFVLPVGVTQGAAAAYRLLADGSFGARVRFDNGAAPPPDLVALVLAADAAGEAPLVIGVLAGSARPVVMTPGPGWALHPVAQAGTGSGSGTGAALTGLAVAQAGGTGVGAATFVLGFSATGDTVTSWRLSPAGQLTRADVLDSLASGTGFAAPSALATVTLGGVAHAVLAGAGSSSLTVLRLGADGRMVAVDHVIDGLDTRFQRVAALELLEVGERVLVLAGGADAGISLLAMLPDGRLIHLSSLADTLATAMANVTAIAAGWGAGRGQVFVAGAAEPGITRLAFDLDAGGVSRLAGAGVVRGTARDDVLVATAATTELHGGDGDDILVAADSATGPLRIWGGAGRDIFVAAPNGRLTTIMDYEPGVDRLDLTLLPMLRSLAQLQIQPTAQGARIRHGDTVIDIVSTAGAPLTLAHFSESVLLPLSRFATGSGVAGETAPPPEPGRLIRLGNGGGTGVGGSGPDTILGGTGNDEIGGGPGNDLIQGTAGANRIWGGLGNDTVQGGSGPDTIYGGGHGTNQLFGNDGNDLILAGSGGDFIAGGAGDDTLRGGDGADTIWGGTGNDNIGGGAGNDLIFGSTGRNLIWGGWGNDTVQGGDGADTIHGGGTGTNHLFGNAGDDLIFAGDGGDLIGGGPGNDTIRGGAGNDTIWGGLGDDNIGGGAGDDLIFGGAGSNLIWGGWGNDTIHAGTGRDVMNGGPGADVFVFASAAHIGLREGRDRIEDFTPGQDRIDLSALATRFNGTAGFSGGGQVSFWHYAPGGLLIGDQTGNGLPDWVIELPGMASLGAGDFVL